MSEPRTGGERTSTKRSFLWLRDFDPSIDEKRGRYSATNASQAEWRPDVNECPYCHNSMERLVRASVLDVNRIADVGAVYAKGTKQRALLQPIPPSHRLLRCLACHQGFTVPETETAG